jgi:hypothetical protein
VIETEYIGGHITNAKYFESWNEKVDCIHEMPCQHRVFNGNVRRYVEEHENDGYRHEFDVEIHPEYFVAQTSNGNLLNITREKYFEIQSKFATSVSVDLNNDFYTKNGNLYRTYWDFNESKFFPVTEIVTQKSKVKTISNQSFEYKFLQKGNLFDYPFPLANNNCLPILSTFSNSDIDSANILLNYYNAILSESKQVFLWILIYKNAPREIAKNQRLYWQDGKKNEFIVLINVNDRNQIKWFDVVSQTNKSELLIKTRNYINRMDTLNAVQISNFLGNKIGPNFVKKQFIDFDYFDVKASLLSLIISSIVTSIVSLSIMLYSIKNDLEYE